jgi:hypothetical protein
MASGVQSNTYLPATTWTNIAAGPTSGRVQTVNISICNQAVLNGTIILATATTGTSTPSTSQYLEYLTPVNNNGGVYERTGFTLGNGQILLAYPSAAGMSAIVYGVEGTAATGSGVQVTALMSASTYTPLTPANATPASGRIRAVSVNFCNTSASVSATIRLALSTNNASSPGTADFLEYNITLPPLGTLERTGVIMSNGYYLYGWASTANVTVVSWGIDDLA